MADLVTNVVSTLALAVAWGLCLLLMYLEHRLFSPPGETFNLQEEALQSLVLALGILLALSLFIHFALGG